jgi:prefoldin subunit 5
MDGMGMLLKSFGIDPQQLQSAAHQVQQTAQAFQAQLNRIEKKLNFLAASILDADELKCYDEIETRSLTNGRDSSHPN